MRILFLITFIINILSSYAQNKNKVLQIKNSDNESLGGVTGIYHNKEEKEIVSALSDRNGNIFLLDNYEKISLRRIGYKDLVLYLNELTQDSTSVILESETYTTPTLIINRATLKYKIDYSDYVSEITVKKIQPYKVSSDTTYFDDGTFDFEVIDSLKVSYDCKIAIPNKWDADYKSFYKLLFNRFTSNNLDILFPKDKVFIEFQICKTGEIIIESINGFQSNSKNWLISYLESWNWRPSDVYALKVDTKHKMLIMLE